MKSARFFALAISLVFGLCAQNASLAQSTAPAATFVPSRVIERVDDSRLVTLRGNTHPMARPQFDQGLVDSQLSMDRMLLVLQRSPDQQAALDQLSSQQYDPTSPNYHHWLTADEFGKLYGPSDSDIAAVTKWLEVHGFQVNSVSKGRVTIDFSGTASQVQRAFQVEMHHYLVNGKLHLANDRDPQVPEALAPVITGIASLNDFFPKHQSVLGRFVTQNRTTGKVTPVNSFSNGPKPLYAFPDPNSGGVTNEDITPYDFATIYNLAPLWSAGITGKGQSIAIAAQTDINAADVATFRTAFGLSTFAGTVKTVLNGADPGVVQGSLTENTLDTEWAGATAPDAQILLVVSKGTSTSPGGLLSINYIIDNQVATIMSASYGECEAGLAAAGNAALNTLYQQGSTEGISLFESAGDQGSAGCDNSDATTYPNPAQNGLQVNGFASSPYITGVGGTDFLWQEDPYTKYWNPTNAANGGNALGYIPELPWNSTCSSTYLLNYVYTGQTSSESLCNNAYKAALDDMIRVVGGSGGASSCLSNTGTFTSCTGAYPKPSWQTGTGVPNDKVRDVPDVSLFASAGLPSGNGGSAYLICVSSDSPDSKCDYTGNDITAQEVGGTSVSSPAMAGIMALVQQKVGSAQGLANPTLYALAAKDNRTACNSSTVANGNSCVFYDVAVGNNAVPCASGSLNCTVSTTGDQYGIINGYTATAGYDQATGLGSVNAYNLVNAWPGGSIASGITLSPSTASFPSTTVNATSPTTSLVTVTNGSSSAIGLTSIGISGTDASSFSDTTTCTTGSSLAAAATCTITVSFKPTAAGSLTATLNVVDGTGTQTVALSGTGATATTILTLSPTSLAFASTTIGKTTAAQAVTVTNGGTGAVTITSSAITGANASSFAISSNTCTSSLAVGATCTVSVTFDPTAASALAATLSVTDNATGSPQTIALTGTGLTPTTILTVSPTSLAFGSTATGTTTAAQAVTLTNAGTGPVTLSSTVITGANASSFTISSNTCKSTLAVVATCAVNITFSPTVAAALAANLAVTDNATGSPQTIALTGTGTVPPPLTTTTTLSSSNLSAGVNESFTLTAAVTKATGVPTGAITFLNGTATLGTGTLNASGVATLTTSIGTVGTDTLTASYGGDATSAQSTSAAITENIVTVGVTATATPSPLTITSGQSGTLTITLTPTGGYTGTVTFSCGTLPTHVSCTFVPPSITIAAGSGPVTDTLTISTDAPTTAMLSLPRFGSSSNNILTATALWLPGLLTLTGLFRRKRNSPAVRRLALLALFCLGLAGLGAMTGCGSASNNAKSGTYSIPITLTVAGSTTQTVSATVVVQ